jgi:hypothetical protein
VANIGDLFRDIDMSEYYNIFITVSEETEMDWAKFKNLTRDNFIPNTKIIKMIPCSELSDNPKFEKGGIYSKYSY